MPETLFYPRPEYPRPDCRRGTLEGYDWLNLNGPWQFRFDVDRTGVKEQWFRSDTLEWREQIIVPFCWESLAAWGQGDTAGNENFYSTRVYRNPLEVSRANHRSAKRYEVGWYKRTVEIPDQKPWQNKHVILHIGAADFFTDCWCNGVFLGHHEGGYTPFEFDLTEAVAESNGKRQATIVLRVEDPMDNAQQPVGKQWHWYTTTSGIWQTVFIEPRHPRFVRCFRIIPDIHSGTARFEIECTGVKDNCSVEIIIGTPDGKTQRVQLEVKNSQAQGTISLVSVKLWDPNSPELYDVILNLHQGNEVLDTVHTYFGIRKIDFELSKNSGVPTALRLNGVARYLRGALYQSYFPDGVYTAASVETLKRDILHAKNFGFNFLRIHIKVDDPMILFWADKLGILLMCDFPNFGEGGDTLLARGRFETMVRKTIERDFNHPSIFAWCLFNETWGFGGQMSFVDKLQEPGTPKSSSAYTPAAGLTIPQVWVQKMWELAKQLDPTRLVEDMSVCHWEHLEYYLHCDTDINSWHFYISDYEKAKAHIDKVVSSTFVGSTFNYVPGFLHKGQPLINSEYGGIGALDGDRDVSWSFKFLTNELRRHQQIAAYIYTELHDVEWEYNGFLNYDRTRKHFGYDPRIINESNALPIDSPPIQRLAPGTTIHLPVASAHFSTMKYDDICLRWQIGGMDSRGQLHQHLSCGSIPIPFPHRKVAHAHIIEERLPDQTMLCVVLLNACTRDGKSVAENIVHYFVTGGYPRAHEVTQRGLVLRGEPAGWAQSEWSEGTGEREKERAEDACYGFGHGFFEWVLPLNGAELSKARRIKILCEASSHRADTPQTDDNVFPTTLQMFLNRVTVYRAVVRNHPHDSRGLLSYLRGGVGAYGYLNHASVEGELLNQVIKAGASDFLSLRCEVPVDARARGGLTIYGAECGRYPICPTVIVEW